MARPKTIWLLLVYFAASFARSVLLLVQNEASAEARLFHAAGIESVYFLLLIASVMLDAGALRYLWLPQPRGLRVALASIGVGLAFALLTAMAAVYDPEVFAAVIAAKAEAAGQEVDPYAIAFATSPMGLAIAAAVALGKSGVVVALLLWNRDYFGAGREASAL
jgi:hypothetical protein